jgi:hypothetical protein
MDTIRTHMSMHAKNKWVAVARFNVGNEIVESLWCRGMLARGGSGGSGVPRSYGEGGGGGEPPPPRGSTGRAEDAGAAEVAGTSNSRGRRGGRRVEGGSSSEAE